MAHAFPALGTASSGNLTSNTGLVWIQLNWTCLVGIFLYLKFLSPIVFIPRATSSILAKPYFLMEASMSRSFECRSRPILFLAFILLAARASSLHAQVVPSATSGQFSISAGGMASAFQPDYAGGFVTGASGNRLYGAGAFVDVKFSRWFQVEAEGRWLRFNQFVDIDETNFLIGPRLPIHHFGRYTPYVKALAGYGLMNFEFNEATGRFTALAYGGGVDVSLTRRISARGDFEYQQWPNWISNEALYPYSASVGISYRIFGGRRRFNP